MSLLDVPSAHLYYEALGSGPLVVMIPGATGTADSFRAVVEHLTAHNRIVIYDRRGFSRSEIDGDQDDGRSLEVDADDVRRLIEHLSDEPATVLGTSSGGVVALELLTRHPSVVSRLHPFEPPVVRLLPDGQRWLDFFTEVYDLYRRSGTEPALRVFREHTFAETDRHAMARARRRDEANAVYWFEHELRQYPAVDLDLTELKTHADRIVPLAGRESRGYPAYQATVELGRRLGREVFELPGGHIGFLTGPAEFASTLLEHS